MKKTYYILSEVCTFFQWFNFRVFFCRTRLNFDDSNKHAGLDDISYQVSPNKRDSDENDVKQENKRQRRSSSLENGNCGTEKSMIEIIVAMERLSMNADLVADWSSCNVLPNHNRKPRWFEDHFHTDGKRVFLNSYMHPTHWRPAYFFILSICTAYAWHQKQQNSYFYCFQLSI